MIKIAVYVIFVFFAILVWEALKVIFKKD